jgi:hypothetical protein
MSSSLLALERLSFKRVVRVQMPRAAAIEYRDSPSGARSPA